MVAHFQPASAARRGSERQWLLAACALLGLAWALWMFGRGWWTPDEPREAALAASVATAPAPLPSLAGELFAEKPPLLYWLAGAARNVLGPSPAASRLPQFLLALLSLAALMSLARRLAGERAAWVAGLLCASAELFLQVQVWLDTDALLLAGTCVALAGLEAGWSATAARARLAGYAAMHAGLTLAFFGKNLAAWMVPVLAFAALLAWERRWRELARWELWLPALLPLACIGAWVARVAAMPGGGEALRVLFYNNLVGRALAGSAAGSFDFASGHGNWPGKYFAELPLYLLPWTPLAAWGLWRAPRNLGAHAWRFALSTALPGLVLLSFAATARGIYAVPCVPGFALLAVLAWREQAPPAGARAAPAGRGLRIALALCAALVIGVAALLLAATLYLSRTVLSPGPVPTALAVVSLLVAIGLAWSTALPRLLAAWCLSLSLGAVLLVPAFDRTQDLGVLAARIQARAAGHALLLVAPDETTRAMAQMDLPEGSWRVVPAGGATGAAAVTGAAGIAGAPVDALALTAAPGSWKGSRWREYLRTGLLSEEVPSALAGIGAGADRGTAAGEPALRAAGYAPVALLERPGGRGYLLWSRAGGAP